ncbi:MAG: proline--tRNA ligase, partial [Burkholderiales bacterium]|nr:proline--tRNA ligase [Burkholderiales bacterium]
KDIRSYRQLPINLYQIQTKFRDEIRPRFGVMRAREFIMKDAYSFDVDVASMLRSYQIMYDAYTRIFTRLSLAFLVVEADNGAIGVIASHEFQVLADSGEDLIAYCPDSDYAANIELAEAVAPAESRPAASEAMEKVATPNMTTCDAVAQLLDLPLKRTAKCLMVIADEKMHMLLIRGDHSMNEVKVGKLPGFSGWRWASDAEIVEAMGCVPGYLGPVNLPKTMPLIVDHSVAIMADFICGANEAGFHLRGVNFGRDVREPDTVADLRNLVAGDPSPDGKGALALLRGIEVGHVFALGNVYAEAMGATYLDAQGESKVMEMGCYGIGVTRIVAAAIEQHHDERGILWPQAMAPFTVAIAPVGYDRNEAVRTAADQLYESLAAQGIEVLLDDRGERPGVMFADLELIGIPHRITIGERGLKEGKFEYQPRSTAEKNAGKNDTISVPVDDIVAFIQEKLVEASELALE